MSNIIIEGDLQIRSDKSVYDETSVHFEARKQYIQWMLESEYNKEENTWISLGDFFELSHPTPRDMTLAIYYLTNLKCKQKIILAGNHDFDRYRNSYSIDPLAEIPGVTLIKTPQDLDIEGLTFKILPFFYDYTIPGLDSMKKTYESLTGTYDFILSHISDETQDFGSGAGINISKLKGVRLQGHIHLGGKGYVESPIPNKISEVLPKRYIKIIDTETSKVLDKEIPNFLNYETVKYPEKLKDLKGLTHLTITEVTDKQLAVDFYKKEYPGISIKEIRKKVLKEFSKDQKSLKKIRPISDLWKEFSTTNKVQKEISEIVLEKIGKASS